MSTVLCSAANGPHNVLLDLARPSFGWYVDKHGWDLVVERDVVCERPASWSKIQMLRQQLSTYDTAIWIDADAMVVDYSSNLLPACPETKPFWLCKHKVARMDVEELPNGGVIVAHRGCEAFLDAIWGQDQYTDDLWWEQSAILHLLGYREVRGGHALEPLAPTEWTDLVGFFSTEWNSMPHDPHPHPAIRHFSGMPFDARREAMS